MAEDVKQKTLGKRAKRHAAIRAIVQNGSVGTQQDLVSQLKLCGFDCTQATISRDISDLGLQKSTGGIYVFPEDIRLQRAIADLVTDVAYAMHTVVVHTQGGGASSLAAAIDEACLGGVLGTVAGDNTVIVITSQTSQAVSFVDLINKFRRR